VIETVINAKAVHAKYRPMPMDIMIPAGTDDDPMTISLMLDVFWISTVQIAEPTSSINDATTANIVENRNVQLLLITPLVNYERKGRAKCSN